MRVFEPSVHTGIGTIARFGSLADRGGAAELVAQAWTDAGFGDELTTRWLSARCFDPQTARALAELGVTPEQAAVRTRDGGGDYVDTIGHKVSNGDLTARQGAARSMSSR